MCVAKPPGIARDERLAGFVQQHDGEHLVVNQPPKQLSYPLEQRPQFQNRSQFHGDFIQDFQRLRLPRDACIEPRIFNRLCNPRGCYGEYSLVLGPEVPGLGALQIHDADQPVLGDQRNGKLGANVRIRAGVKLHACHIVQQDWLARESYLSYDAFSDGNPGALHLRRMPDLESHAQLVGAVVQKEDGEDAVIDDGPHQLRRAVEQSLQIERGIQRVGQLHQINNVGRLDAWIHRIQRRIARRAVVTFELGSVRRNVCCVCHMCRRE